MNCVWQIQYIPITACQDVFVNQTYSTLQTYWRRFGFPGALGLLALNSKKTRGWAQYYYGNLWRFHNLFTNGSAAFNESCAFFGYNSATGSGRCGKTGNRPCGGFVYTYMFILVISTQSLYNIKWKRSNKECIILTEFHFTFYECYCDLVLATFGNMVHTGITPNSKLKSLVVIPLWRFPVPRKTNTTFTSAAKPQWFYWHNNCYWGYLDINVDQLHCWPDGFMER